MPVRIAMEEEAAVAGFGLTETHISILIFTPDRVYKIKKPVVFGFVDLSSVAARVNACVDEVALNSRLAPDVYEGVGRFAGPDGAVEPVVVMRRLPAESRLTNIIVGDGAAAHRAIRDIASRLADFHEHAARRGPDVAAACTAEAVESLWRTNLSELQTVTAGLIDTKWMHRASELADKYLGGRRAAFAERIRRDRSVEGHGDLLCDDIFCLPDGPRLLDCLEFDPVLRCVDTLHDACSLACDLEAHGRADLAELFLEEYRHASGDAWPPSLQHFYMAYRAAVRAKVECLGAGAPADRAGRASQRLGQALDHLAQGQIRTVLVGGLPGTGKSTMARSLHDATGWPVISSDVVRKRLVGLEPGDDATAPFGEGLYSTNHTALTYAALLNEAEALMRSGYSVIIDASWTTDQWRRAARRMASDCAATLSELRCVAPTRIAHGRIRSRSAHALHTSDATPEIADEMASATEPWSQATYIDTTDDRATALREALTAIFESDAR